MTYLVVAFSAVIAGVIQSATGFGAAIFLMLVLPHFFGMVSAPALASAIAMCLGISLAWHFRRHIDPRICLFPTLVYLMFSIPMIQMVKGLDLGLLTLIFGAFLIALAAYFFLFSAKLSFSASWKTACVCAAISGAASGLFGIGGPLMAVYFVSATDKKESYIGNIQFLFAATNVINLLTRMANGIYTTDLLPFTLLGLVGILLGRKIGLKILDRLDPNATKRLVYAFVGISGVVTVLQQLT